MTDKKKPPSFGEHSKEFLEAFEQETKKLQEERAELQKKRQLIEKRKENAEAEKKSLLESLKKLDEIDRGTVEQPAADPTDVLRETAETPVDDRMSRYVKTLRDVDQQQKKREVAEGVELKETDLLGAADQAVTQAQLRKATGELFARVQTSLASLGGGGLGTIMQGVEGTPSDGQLPMYDDSSGKMVWATVFGVGEAYSDSDALAVILDTVDSAYVQARVNGGLDSAQVINLIDSAYVAARDSDLQGSFYTTADHDSDTLVQVDSAYVQARAGEHYTDSDVIALLNGDSGVQNVIPQLDSTYDLGSATNKWRDLYLSGSTIHLGSIDLKSGGDSGVGLYANGRKLAYAENDYTTADHDSDTLVQVDSAYVQKRQIRTLAGLDDTQIDSATIAADDFLQWNGTDWIAAPFNIDPGLSFNGSIDATADSAPAAVGGALYVNTGSGVVLGSYNGIAGDSIDSGQAIAYAESDGTWHILGNVNEAGVVEVRQGNGISIDDSNPARPFVAINRVETDTWYLDSARTIAMIDSAYVQARQIMGLDSAAVVAIVDSYVDSEFVIRHADSHFVNVAGDSMTGKLFAPAIQIGPASAGVNSAILEFRTSDSTHELEVISGGNSSDEGGTDFDTGWVAAPDTVKRYTWKSVAYGAGTWVAVADDYNAVWSVVYSTDDGITWEGVNPSEDVTPPKPGGAYAQFKEVIYDNGKFYTVGYYSNLPATPHLWKSTDGITWTDSTPFNTSGNAATSIAYDGAGTLVVVFGSTGGGIEYSTDDGATWTAATVSVDAFSRVVYANGVFIAISSDSTGPRIAKSTDGITWTTITSAADTAQWYGLAYGGGTWVATGFSGKTMYSTDNGDTWTDQTLTYSNIHYWDVEYGDGVFMAVATGGSNSSVKRVAYSEDGISWEYVTPIKNQLYFYAVGYGGGRFLLGAAKSTPQFIVLEHGSTFGGLFFDGSQVATRANLEPVFDVLNNLSTRAGTRLHFQDSDPAATDSAIEGNIIRDAQFWYNTATSTLSIRDSGAWQQIGGGGSSVTIDSVAPSSPTDGELWYDPTTSVLHIRDSGAWDSINAQDSGAYLLLTGGTVTGPLNLDSGGVQLGPEGYRYKLIAGVYTRIETWTSQDNAFDSAVGGGGFGVADLAYDPDTNILIAGSRKDHTVFWSDDKGVTWNRSTDSAGNDWVIEIQPPNDEIRNTYYLPEVKRWIISDTKTNSIFISDNGKDNWRQPYFDSVNSAPNNLEFHQGGTYFDVIYDDSLNPVIYGTVAAADMSRSFDSGSSWIYLDHDQIGFDPLRNRINRPFYSKKRRLSKVVGWYDDGSGPDLMYSSTDARNWTRLTDSSPGGAAIYTVFDSDRDIVVHSTGNNTHWSEDFGETWNLSQIVADSGRFGISIVDATVTETGAYYAIANSSYGKGGYTSNDLKEWFLVDRITGLTDVSAVEHLGDGNYVRSTRNFGDDISTSSFSSSTVDIGTLNFDGKRVMLEPDMDSEHAWNIAEHQNLFDSLQALIDSDHAWANETFYDSVSIKTLIDSGYVQARVPAGTYIAGGRFIANSGFTHDSSDVTPTRFVKNLFGIKDITRDDAGEYTLTFDSATNTALQDSYSYIVTTTIDYRRDNPTASSRNVAVLHQDSHAFTLLMERADDGVNQDYGSLDGGARINFTVIKAD